MRILGNFGTIRIGATAGAEFYWKKQWSIHYWKATAKLVKEVKLSDEELQSFYITGGGDGEITLNLTQGSVTAAVNLSDRNLKLIDMSAFQKGKIKMILDMNAAKNINVRVGWRDQK